MPYLDISPMLTALRTTPDRFELADGWLHHIPSSHSFRLGPDDGVEIFAHCDCAQLNVRPEQRALLVVGFQEWERRYWKPLLINREFASHFSRQAGVLGMLILITQRIQRWLVERERRHVAIGAVPEKGITALQQGGAAR